MSYDLFFTEPIIAREQYVAYFSGRKHYKLKNTQAWYENPDTGVYFSFDYSDDPPAGPDVREGRVSFSLNCFRPHFFGLEADPEVRALVEHFAFCVSDPQGDEIVASEFTKDCFLRGWNHSNESGCRAFLQSDSPPGVPHTRPSIELEAIWRWNWDRQELQHTLGRAGYVPRVMFVLIDGRLHSATVWPDSIPTLVPVVDALLIPRRELVPPQCAAGEDMCVVLSDGGHHVLAPYRTNDYALPAFSVPGPPAPPEVVNYVKSLTPFGAPLTGVQMDQVLDRELVEKARLG